MAKRSRQRAPGARGLALLVLALSAVVGGRSGAAQETPAPPAPAGPVATATPELDGFARLVGGRWKIGDLTAVYEWGLGRRTVLARTYDGAGNQLSEIRFFYDPRRAQIVGHSVDATGEDFAEILVRFEGDVVVDREQLFGPDGAAGDEFVGRWVFTDADHFDWTLAQLRGGRSLPRLSLSATRVPPTPSAPERSER